jgi:hypothetical protein
VFIGGYSYGAEDGTYADGVMSRVTLRAIAAGDSQLEIVHARLADVNGTLVEPAVHSTEVSVTDS